MADLTESYQENDGSQQEMMLEEVFEKAEQQLKEENEKIKSLEQSVEEESPEDVDNRSVFVGNVEYTASPDEVQEHFKESGTINRVTILCDKFTGHPKGFAYVEFQDKDSIQQALLLNDSLFKGRKIKVIPKRTNLPNMTRGRKMRRRSSIYGARGRWMYVRPPRRFGRFRHF